MGKIDWTKVLLNALCTGGIAGIANYFVSVNNGQAISTAIITATLIGLSSFLHQIQAKTNDDNGGSELVQSPRVGAKINRKGTWNFQKVFLF